MSDTKNENVSNATKTSTPTLREKLGLWRSRLYAGRSHAAPLYSKGDAELLIDLIRFVDDDIQSDGRGMLTAEQRGMILTLIYRYLDVDEFVAKEIIRHEGEIANLRYQRQVRQAIHDYEDTELLRELKARELYHAWRSDANNASAPSTWSAVADEARASWYTLADTHLTQSLRERRARFFFNEWATNAFLNSNALSIPDWETLSDEAKRKWLRKADQSIDATEVAMIDKAKQETASQLPEGYKLRRTSLDIKSTQVSAFQIEHEPAGLTYTYVRWDKVGLKVPPTQLATLMYEMFPEIPRSEHERLAEFSQRVVELHNAGAPGVTLTDNE